MRLAKALCGIFVINTFVGLIYAILCPLERLLAVGLEIMLSACLAQGFWWIFRSMERDMATIQELQRRENEWNQGSRT